jgi:hypothetical protein
MIKLLLKIAIIIILCASTFLAKAQIGYDYAQYDVGFAAGLNTGVITDVASTKTAPSINFNFNYNHTPYLNYIFEASIGRLKGGDSLKTVGGGREFENHFAAFALRVQLQGGEIFDYSKSNVANAFKGLYLSTGIGYLVNHIVAKSADRRQPEGVPLPGNNNTNIPYIPLRIGYELKLFNQYSEPSVKFDIGYQFNYVLNDNLDGYATGGYNDSFSQLTLGVKFAIGGVTSYRKQIHY